VYGHTLDWKSNEEAAKGLGEQIAKVVREAEGNLNSGPLLASKQEDLLTPNLEVLIN
jgi:hypothetical protein